MDIRVKLWGQAEPKGECRLWTGGRTSDGYGLIWFMGESVYTHRLAYELAVGEIPEGLEIDHLCRRRACINPAHLEPVTHRENALRGVGPLAVNARKTHCIRGHEFDEKNTYHPARGGRQCRRCRADAERRRKQRLSAVA